MAEPSSARGARRRATLCGLLIAALSAGATAQGPAPAHLRWVHGCAEAGSVRLELEGEQIGAALELGQASDYQQAAAAVQTASFHDLRGEIFQSGVRLEAKAFYTVVLWGSRGQPRLLIVEDRLPQAAGSAAIRWVHAAQGVPGLELRSELGIRLLPELEAGTVADYRAVPVGVYGLKVTEAGAADALLEIGAQSFRAGGAYTFVLTREHDRYQLIGLRDR